MPSSIILNLFFAAKKYITSLINFIKLQPKNVENKKFNIAENFCNTEKEFHINQRKY